MGAENGKIIEALTQKSIKNKAGSTAAESVAIPFETVKPIYDYFSKVYAPLGLTLDYDRLCNTQPVIAKLLQQP